MNILLRSDADIYLMQVGMKIGDWNQIAYTSAAQESTVDWINHQAPNGAQELYVYSQHVASWLPKGDWKIFQVDDSGCLEADEEFLFSRLLFGQQKSLSLNDSTSPRTFVFEFGKGKEIDTATELLIANLIYVFLLFKSHAYVVSSKSVIGQRLGIQDGFVYFSSQGNGIPTAKLLIENFENNPLSSPEWIEGR